MVTLRSGSDCCVGAVIEKVTVAVAVCGVVAVFVAVIVTDALLVAVGVPEITPVEVFKVKPAGNVPEVTA